MASGDELLRAIFESSALGIGVVDREMKFRSASPALLRMLGYTAEELFSLTPDDLTHPDDIEGDSRLFEELLNGQRSSYEVEKRYLRKDGAERWARLSVSIHPTQSPPLIIGMVEDITERRAALQHERAVSRDLKERVKELTALHLATKVIQQVGMTWVERLQELAQLLPPAMQYPEITTACVRYGGNVLATPSHTTTPWVLSCSIETSDGQRGTIEVAYHEARKEEAQGPFLAEEVALLGSLAEMLRAALDRDHAEAALRQVNERLNLALRTADMGVWEWDVRNNSARWSEHLSEMMGIDVSAGPFKGQAARIHPEDREYLFQRLELAAQGADDLRAVEFRYLRSDGSWRHVMGRGRVIREPNERATRVLAALVDVSERRALEESVRQTQKVESLGQVASGVAHDFNNLLTVILSNTGILRAEMPRDHPFREIVDEIHAAGESGAALTRQLLAFSRKEAFQPAAVNVCDLISRIEPILKRIANKAVQVRLQLDRAAGSVWADPTQVEQVVMNLVVNARDAMPNGGVITVSTSVTSTDGADAPGSSSAGRQAVIEVSDTGTGIEPEVQRRMFEPFFTTKEAGKGTGLGLATVANVARQWGGQVSVQSVIGQGATFRVLFPRLDG